jgi:hypothetical protein
MHIKYVSDNRHCPTKYNYNSTIEGIKTRYYLITIIIVLNLIGIHFSFVLRYVKYIHVSDSVMKINLTLAPEM